MSDLEVRDSGCLAGEGQWLAWKREGRVLPAVYLTLLVLYSYVSHTLLLCLSDNSLSHSTRITHTHTHFLSLTCTEAFEVYVLCYVIHCRMQPPDIVRHML